MLIHLVSVRVIFILKKSRDYKQYILILLQNPLVLYTLHLLFSLRIGSVTANMHPYRE